MDVVKFPAGGLEPNHALLMPACRDEIHLAVAIDICRLDVRRSALTIGEQMPGPRFARVARGLPPGKVRLGRRFRLIASLGRERNIRAAIAIDIAESKIVAQPRGIFIREYVP